MTKKKLLICEFCGWKTVSEPERSGLYELKSDTLSNRKWRCPKCGRAVTPRKCKDPQAEIERKKKEDILKMDDEKWMEENVAFRKDFMEKNDDEDKPD